MALAWLERRSWLCQQLFGFARNARRREELADSLYAKAVAQARLPVFYAECAVPDTLDGRFDLLALHVFLLLHRLEGGDLAQALFDLMFADMDRSLREMGVSDMSVGKRVKEMARALYGRIDAYEPALGDAAALEQALARNLYRGADVPVAALGRVARYVQAQAAHLAALADGKDLTFTTPEAA